MSRYKFAASLIVACTAVVPLTARAQASDMAGTFYSNGVQAYFRGCSAEAESLFSNVIGVDPKDPRAFYFRALSLMQQGREDEARSDMEIGAQVEARFPNRFDIGKTLERVQGPTRLLLEQYRSRARATAVMNRPVGPVRAPDTAVLRERRIVPLDEFSHPGEPRTIAAPEVSPETISPPAAAAEKPAEKPGPAPAAQTNPFNDEGTAEPAPKAQPKTPPAKAPAVETPPAKAPTPPAPKPTPPASKSPDDNPFL